MSILVIAEHDNEELKGATLNTITAAKEIGTEIDLLIAGFSCETVADQACSIPGIRKVIVSDSESYKNFSKRIFRNGYYNKCNRSHSGQN